MLFLRIQYTFYMYMRTGCPWSKSDRVLVIGYPLHRENRENGKKKSLSGKSQGIWKFCQNTGKTHGIWFAQVWFAKIFAMKISIFVKAG